MSTLIAIQNTQNDLNAGFTAEGRLFLRRPENASAVTVDLARESVELRLSVVPSGNVYTATLSSPVTGSPLDITLSNGQHIVIGVGSVVAMLAIGETIDDAEIYRGFFDKLAQSAFLTGHDI